MHIAFGALSGALISGCCTRGGRLIIVQFVPVQLKLPGVPLTSERAGDGGGRASPPSHLGEEGRVAKEVSRDAQAAFAQGGGWFGAVQAREELILLPSGKGLGWRELGRCSKVSLALGLGPCGVGCGVKPPCPTLVAWSTCPGRGRLCSSRGMGGGINGEGSWEKLVCEGELCQGACARERALVRAHGAVLN